MGAELSTVVGGEILSGQPSALPCPGLLWAPRAGEVEDRAPAVPSQVLSVRASEMSSLELCGSGADPRLPPPALPPLRRSLHLCASTSRVQGQLQHLPLRLA